VDHRLDALTPIKSPSEPSRPYPSRAGALVDVVPVALGEVIDHNRSKPAGRALNGVRAD